MRGSSLLLLLFASTARPCLNIIYTAQSPLLPQEQVHFDLLNMSMASVSRTVTKRVLAVETPEVSGPHGLKSESTLRMSVGRGCACAAKHWFDDAQKLNTFPHAGSFPRR